MDDKKQILKAIMKSLEEHPDDWLVDDEWGWRTNLKHKTNGIEIENAFCSFDDYLMLGYPYVNKPYTVNFNFIDRLFLWDKLREIKNKRKKLKQNEEISEIKKAFNI